MSDKIEYNDLFADDAFSKAVTGMEAVLNSFKNFQEEIRHSLILQKEFFTGFKAKSYEDINKLNDAIKRAEETLKSFTIANNAVKQSEIELEKIKQEKIKTAKLEIELEKKQTAAKPKVLSLYQQESKILRDLKNEYKNVALAQGTMSKAAQDLLAKITPLDAKLKALDKTTGDNFRNVGNYSSGLKSLQSGLTNVLGAAGIGVGLSAGFDFLKDSVNEFASLEKSLKNLQAITGVSSKDLEFFSNNAEELGVNVKGGAVAVVEAYKLIGSAKPELLENKEALNEVTKAAITLSQASGLELPEAATQLTQALNSFSAPASDAGKFINILAASSKLGAKEIPFVAEALSKFGGVAKSAGVTIEQSAAAIEILGAKIPQAETVGTNLRGIFTKMQTEAAKSKREFKGLGGELDLLAPKVNDITYLSKTYGEQNLLAIQTLIKERDALADFTNGITDTNAALEQATINTDTFEQRQLVLENRFKSIKSAVGEYIVNNLTLLGDVYDTLTNKTNIFEQAQKKMNEGFLGIKGNKEKSEELIKKTSEEQKAFLAKNAALRQINQTNFDSGEINFVLYNIRRTALREELNSYTVLLNAKIKDGKATKKLADEAKKIGITGGPDYQNSRKAEKKKEAVNDRTKINEALRKVDEEYAQQQLDDEDARLKQQKDFNNSQIQLEIDSVNKKKEIAEQLAAEEKARKEKELKDLADLAQKSLSIAEKGISAKQKKIDEALDREIEANEKNRDRQRELADKGLSNTLAFEDEKAALLERKKEEEAKKVLKREKTLAFFKLFAANAGQDPNTALQKTLIEMAIGEGIAAAFIEGTENVGKDAQFTGNKFSNKKDGYIARFDGDERIINPSDNAKIGNMSNEDLAMLAYDYQNGLMPKYAIADSMESYGMTNVHASAQLNQLVTLNKRMESLENTIKNKKEVSFAFDNIGNVVRSQIENGLRIKETRKRI